MKLSALVAACFLTTSDAFSTTVQRTRTRRRRNRHEGHHRMLVPNHQRATILYPLKLYYSLTANAELTQMVSLHPLALSSLAGLSTCLGAAIVFFLSDNNGDETAAKPLSDAHLSASLSLAGSVMVTVTVISILPESFSDTSTLLPGVPMILERALFVTAGLAAYVALAQWVLPNEPPEYILAAESPEALQISATETHLQSSTTTNEKDLLASTTEDARRSWRMAIVLFWSLLLHNFPEGLAVAVSAVHSPRLGLTTAVAISLHNIPEGIAIAVPCLAARPKEPLLAFGLASLSGLAEPLGAYFTLVMLHQQSFDVLPWMPDVLAFVSGIMATVALVELFPEALKHSKQGHGPFWAGLLVGTLLMIGTEAVLTG
mmetsp:Transcript_16694/g.33675  ORF Transcript_16694/g.33675 Transcript_16694/m.33675 type:complete len:374 (+) Transcript_16694:41-1162(+)